MYIHKAPECFEMSLSKPEGKHTNFIIDFLFLAQVIANST